MNKIMSPWSLLIDNAKVARDKLVKDRIPVEALMLTLNIGLYLMEDRSIKLFLELKTQIENVIRRGDDERNNLIRKGW